MTDARERIVDVRDLEPPGPLQNALAAARSLRPGEYVALLHRREPLPLFAMLAQLGMCHRTIRGGDVPFRVLIWRRDDAAATACCGPADAVPPGAPEPCA